MKKVAIIASTYGGSSIALAKSWIDKGYSVDYIKLETWRQDFTFEACEGRFNIDFLGLKEVGRENELSIFKYIPSVNFRLFALSSPRPYKSVPVLRYIIRTIRNVIIAKAAIALNQEKYDSINVIGRFDSNELLPLIKKLSSKVILTLHEPSDKKNDVHIYNETRLMKYAFDKQLDIVVHSDSSYNDILNYNRVKKEKVHNIPFGAFGLYSFVTDATVPNLPDRYLLFFGYVRPYKGLKVLYEAVRSCPELYDELKILVAGMGDDPILEKIKEDNHFVCINRFVTNQELVSIIKKSYAVVCSYLNMSQSGIPQTAIVFKKPLIASDLQSFRDVIADGIDGYLFETGNSGDFNEKVRSLQDKETYERMIGSLSNYNDLHPSLSWENIANQYIKAKLI